MLFFFLEFLRINEIAKGKKQTNKQTNKKKNKQNKNKTYAIILGDNSTCQRSLLCFPNGAVVVKQAIVFLPGATLVGSVCVR